MRRRHACCQSCRKAALRSPHWTALRSAGLWPARSHARLAALLLAVNLASLVAAEDGQALPPTEIRFVYSKRMFVDVNENDARAAVKVYTQTIGDQNGIYVSSAPELLDGTNAIATAITNKQADVFILTAEEFFALEHHGLEGPVLLARIRETFTEDYLLLARENGTLRQVEDLKGRNLIVSGDARTSLANIWLDVLCRERGLGPATQLLGKLTHTPKLTQVVLPVFFGKADACLVTRNGWEVMCELNPQLKRQLRVFASSPPLVPTVTCFRGDLTEALKHRILREVDLSSGKPAFKQVMAMFRIDGLVTKPLAVLEDTRALVARHHQLCAGENRSRSVALQRGAPPDATEGKDK